MNVNETLRDDGLTELEVIADVADVRDWIEQWRASGVEGASRLGSYDELDLSDEKTQVAAKRAVMQVGSECILDDKLPSPMETPWIGAKDDLEKGESFAFTIRYAALPARELSSYGPATVRLPTIKVSEQEIDDEIAEMLKTVPAAQERPEGSVVEQGDTVEISMEATSDDVRYEALSSKLRQYRLGDNFLPPAFDEALLGLHVGEEADCELLIEHKEHADDPEPADEDKAYTPVTVHLKLLRILRDDTSVIDDSFVRRQFPGIGGVSQLREGIRKEIFEAKNLMVEEQKISTVLGELSKRVQGGIPDAIYDAYYDMVVQNFDAKLAEEGQTHESFLQQEEIDEGEFRMRVMWDIRGQLLGAMALDAWARHYGISASEDDVNDFLNYVNDAEGAEAVQKLEEAPYHGGIVESARRHLAQNDAVERAVVKRF